MNPPELRPQPVEGSDESLESRCVTAALDETESLLPPGSRINREPGAPLLVPEGVLDSFGILNLVAALEREADSAAGVHLGLVEALALPEEESPFRSVGDLEAWVRRRLEGGR